MQSFIPAAIFLVNVG